MSAENTTTTGTSITATATPSSKAESYPASNSEIQLSSASSDDSNDTLLCLNFNQDGGCLAVGTEQGFRICNTMPFLETFRRKFHQQDSIDNDNASSNNIHSGGGGIGRIEMLYRCNLLALVGGGSSPQYQKNKVLIWDDHLGRPIGELSFRQRVLTVKMRRDRICVALRDRIYVYNFSNLSLLDTIVTGSNPLGLLCISTDVGSSFGGDGGAKDDSGMVLACPSVTNGQARVELYFKRKTLLIDAHESELAAMALSVDGQYLATASVKGTIVRLFSTMESSKGLDSTQPIGVPLREFRRGVEQAVIGCLSFSLDKCWLACASDRGTVHIFRVKDEDPMDSMANIKDNNSNFSRNTKKEKSKSSSFVKKILPSVLTMSPKTFLLEGENSFVQVRGITHPKACAFVPDQSHTIAVAGFDDFGNGCLLLARFGPAGSTRSTDQSNGDNRIKSDGQHSSTSKGEAQRLAYHRFFKKSNGRTRNNTFDLESNLGPLKISDVDIPLTNDAEEIVFENDVEDGFVSVIADQNKSSTQSKDDLSSQDENTMDTYKNSDLTNCVDEKTSMSMVDEVTESTDESGRKNNEDSKE